MIWQRRILAILLALVAAFAGRCASADAYDPPVGYYTGTTGLTGSALKTQLHKLIDAVDDGGISDFVATSLSYDSARANLQVTDANPANAGQMLTVYDRTPLVLSTIGPVSGIPGWDPNVWNREHTWPRSRGIGSSGPDDSDLHLLRPAITDNNGQRADLNFGGAYGTSVNGSKISVSGNDFWYPGNAEAGMVARQMFYGAVRYEGGEGSTLNLELANGFVANPSGSDDAPPQLGDLSRLIEWHFEVVPDTFERRRNDVIFDQFQNNRNPFVDHPEWVWSIFKATNNNSLIGIQGQPVVAGATTKYIDLGRVFVGGSVPAAQSVTLVKEGTDGTYYEVTTSGDATSTVTGRLNAFRTNASGITKTFNVGLSSTTTTAGLKSGTVTVDNLDITGAAGSGQGAGDGNDTINLSLAVLDHATPSFDGDSTLTSLMYDFGSVAMGSAAPTFNFDLFNRSTTVGFTADLDFGSLTPGGDAASLAALTTNLAGSAGNLTLNEGTSHQFTAMLDTSAVGSFAATFMLNLSDEDLPGALNKMLTLSLMGEVTSTLLAGDYNRDGTVDAADYVVWRSTYGTSVTPFDGADGDGSGTIGDEDYPIWMAHFGATAGPGAGAAQGVAAVPEPAAWVLAVVGGILWCGELSRKRIAKPRAGLG